MSGECFECGHPLCQCREGREWAMNTTGLVQCDKCGIWYGVGGYPFCKGGHGRYNVNVIDDQIEGGPRFFETFGHEKVWIGSKSEWRAAVDRYQVVNVDKHDSAHYAKQRKMHDEKLRDERL